MSHSAAGTRILAPQFCC